MNHLTWTQDKEYPDIFNAHGKSGFGYCRRLEERDSNSKNREYIAVLEIFTPSKLIIYHECIDNNTMEIAEQFEKDLITMLENERHETYKQYEL